MAFATLMRSIFSYSGMLLLVVGVASCSSTSMIQSIPQIKPIVVDGNPIEWQQPLPYYDKETKLSFSISNDSMNLYFCFQAFDQELQTKIIRDGLQIFLDTFGGASQDVSVLYPVPSTLQHVEPPRSSGYGSSSDDFDPIGALRRSFFRSEANEMQLTGFLPPAAGLVPLKNIFGVEVRINWDTINNVLNYEAAIPFGAFYKRMLTSADSTKILGVTFTVNGVNRPADNKRPKEPEETAGGDGNYPGGGIGGYSSGAGGPGGGFGGGGMGRGGGRHGGGRGGSESTPLSESQSLSVKLRLTRTD